MMQLRRAIRNSVPSLHSLVLFEAAARHLNFSKAANELSITQPAVSHGIRQLEAMLGHPLFVREHRALSLTSQGLRLYSAVATGFATISETLADISGSDHRDSVVVSTSTVLATEWLLPRLSSLRGLHPQLRVEIRSLDRDPDLAASNIDVHVRLGDGQWPGCRSIKLWAEHIVPVCSPDYLERNGPFRDLSELLFQRLIHYVDPYRFRIGWAEWLRAIGISMPLNLPGTLHVNDSLVALKAAEVGEGVALGWRPIVNRALDEGRLVRAHSSYLLTGHHHYAVTNETPSPSKAVLQFCDWLADQGSTP